VVVHEQIKPAESREFAIINRWLTKFTVEFLTVIVDGEISCHRIKPSDEFVLTVRLMATFQHTNPCFLEEVLRQFTISREVHQITQQPMLILLDETVQQLRIAPRRPRAIALASDSMSIMRKYAEAFMLPECG
jgi:hypothetical protein